MKVGYSPGLSFKPLTGSGSRLGLTLIITFMVMSSPILIFLNPVLISAKSNNIDTSSQHSAFSLGDTTTPLMSPSTNVSPLDSDFTTQAALTGVNARQTNNIVGVQSYYDVVFTTTTTGTIKFIDITFPAGTVIGVAPLLVEREGIGAGTAAKTSATQIRYTVTSAVSVPAGTQIRLEFFNIVNPTLPNTVYKVAVTTRDAGGTAIDGPTASNSLNMKQISTGQIADGAITGNKIAGIQKLLFAQCTLPAGSGSIAAGDTDFIDCSVSGAQIGDVVTGEYLGLSSGTQFSNNLLVVAMRVTNVDSVTLFIENTDDVSELDLDNQQFSLIVFRK